MCWWFYYTNLDKASESMRLIIAQLEKNLNLMALSMQSNNDVGGAMTSNTSQESQYIEMHKITGTSVNPQNEYLQNLHSLDQNRFIFLGTIIFDE